MAKKVLTKQWELLKYPIVIRTGRFVVLEYREDLGQNIAPIKEELVSKYSHTNGGLKAMEADIWVRTFNKAVTVIHISEI